VNSPAVRITKDRRYITIYAQAIILNHEHVITATRKNDKSDICVRAGDVLCVLV